MDKLEADPNYQREVDIMIFDYLLCTAIDRVLGSGRHEYPDNGDAAWLNHTLKTFTSVLPVLEALPNDIQMKIQLLELANILNSCQQSPAMQGLLAVPQTVATAFISLCNAVDGMLLSSHEAEIIAQLGFCAALTEYQSKKGTSEDPTKYLTDTLEEIKHISKGKALEDIENKAYMLPPEGVSLDAHLAVINQKLPPHEIKAAAFEFIAKIMMLLETPILIQMERGKIGRLSRAETQKLKERIGL